MTWHRGRILAPRGQDLRGLPKGSSRAGSCHHVLSHHPSQGTGQGRVNLRPRSCCGDGDRRGQDAGPQVEVRSRPSEGNWGQIRTQDGQMGQQQGQQMRSGQDVCRPRPAGFMATHSCDRPPNWVRKAHLLFSPYGFLGWDSEKHAPSLPVLK